MKGLIYFLIGVTCYGATPKPPETIYLDYAKVTAIDLNPAIATVLLFPETIDWIAGVGLTDGYAKGAVHFEQDPEGNLLVLRPLLAEFKVSMTIFAGGGFYILDLRPSEMPNSAITFTTEEVGAGQGSRAEQITQAELAEALLPPSKERQAELIRLVREEPVIKRKLPQVYSGYESQELKLSKMVYPFSVNIERVGRFIKEDTLVFIGTIKNSGGKPATFPSHKLRLKINGRAMYSFSKFEVERLFLGKNDTTRFAAVLVGNGKSGPGAINLSNKFEFSVIGGQL